MSGQQPNPQLQAAINRFFQPPDTTLQQAAQLSNAISQQPGLLARLNQQAASGQLSGFAMAVAGSGNRVGTYDKASGVMTLPAESFQPQGQAPSADLGAVLRVQEMSMRFAHGSYQDSHGRQQPVSQDMLTNLLATLNESPWLAEQIKLAASTVDPADPKRRHHLEQFAPLSQRGAGATYDGNAKSMNLSMDRLSSSVFDFKNGPKAAIGDMTYVIGHEVQHAFDHPAHDRAWQTFIGQVRAIAKDRNPVNDYTVPLGHYLHSARQGEARAQLSGWNATLSRVQQSEHHPTYYDVLKQTGRAFDFVQGPQFGRPNIQNVTPRPGITFNPNLSVPMTAANIEQLGKNYFDKPGNQSHLGHHSDSDYANYYAAGAVGAIVQMDRQYAPAGSRMQLDMQRLGISEYQLERNGIHLGNNTAPMPYYDASQPPLNLHHFDHTRTQGVYQHIPVVPASRLSRGEDITPTRDAGDAGRQDGYPNQQTGLSPVRDFSAYLDRMLVAAAAGDDATFRRMTQTLAELPAGRAIRAEAAAAVDLQEQLAAQQLAEQQRSQEMEAPARRMHR